MLSFFSRLCLMPLHLSPALKSTPSVRALYSPFFIVPTDIQKRSGLPTSSVPSGSLVSLSLFSSPSPASFFAVFRRNWFIYKSIIQLMIGNVEASPGRNFDRPFGTRSLAYELPGPLLASGPESSQSNSVFCSNNFAIIDFNCLMYSMFLQTRKQDVLHRKCSQRVGNQENRKDTSEPDRLRRYSLSCKGVYTRSGQRSCSVGTLCPHGGPLQADDFASTIGRV